MKQRNVQQLMGNNLMFPYIQNFVAERDDNKKPTDRKIVSFVVDPSDKIAVGDFFVDKFGEHGFIHLARSGYAEAVDGYYVAEIIEERPPKGDYSFTTIEPLLQKVIAVPAKLSTPSEIHYEELGLPRP